MSAILDEGNLERVYCGTPLYCSPQLHQKQIYSSKVDSWALGVMLYKMLMGGTTPFDSETLEDLVLKIEDGHYVLKLQEPITIECALFLIQCLQYEESDRISIIEMQEHPFISDRNQGNLLTPLKLDSYNEEMTADSLTEASSFVTESENFVQVEDGAFSVVLSTKDCGILEILKR